MFANEGWRSSVLAVPVGDGGRVCLGVARTRAGDWVVWIYASGGEIERLSAWGSRDLADSAFRRYIAALKKGRQKFAREIEQSRASTGYVQPHDFSSAELDELRRLARDLIE
jgi:hypothetical protein